MSEVDTQAAVDEPTVTAAPVTTETSARNDDDLDSLLNTFETQTAKPSAPAAAPEPKSEAADTIKDASAEVLAARDEIRTERFQRDMKATISEVRGDLPDDFYDDDFVESWIDAQAKKDPRLATAWMNRATQPQKFAQVKAALGRQFAKKYSKLPDRGATEDRAAVADAVRGSSTRASQGQPPNYAAMSDHELQKEKERYA